MGKRLNISVVLPLLPPAQHSVFPAEINKVGTEETIAALSVGAVLIHSSSASLMDHGSSQEHTKTDRDLCASPLLIHRLSIASHIMRKKRFV